MLNAHFNNQHGVNLRRRRRRFNRDRNGTLILIVLVTIVILSLAAYSFASLMQTEAEAARFLTFRVQTKYLADSGLDYARLFLSNSEATIMEKGGRWDNEETFRGIPVAAEQNQSGRIGYVSLIAPNVDSDGNAAGSRFGIIDESSKINLNVLPFYDALQEGAGSETLLQLPNMTEEVADSIMDWLDSDDETRDYGAESSFYAGLSPAYAAKNGPMDSLEELLLVNGVTTELLFGLDTNRNGVLDPEEATAGDVSVDDSDMYLGWANYLTLYSKESNLNAQGLPRINVNADDLEQLYDDLKSSFNDEWANFIILYRCADAARIQPVGAADLANKSSSLQGSRVTLDFATLTSQRKLNNILDIFSVSIDVGATGDDEGFPGVSTPDDVFSDTVNSPVNILNMGIAVPAMMASLTTYAGASIPGRINIMQASRRVLLAIPGLEEETVDDIIDRRGTDFELDDPDGADLNRRYETWLMVEGVVDPETMKGLMTYICAGGDVYRAEIVGYFPDGIGTSRAEAVIDTTVAIPRILFWKDKSHLPAGYSVDLLGVDQQ
jgi:hypothetical protein